jgi:PAS domain S-box-containing protein/MYXO-CTERM domain-containing protein
MNNQSFTGPPLALETTPFDQARRADSELASLPATKRELWVASAVVLLSVLICVAVIPFSRIPLTRVIAFIPAYESALAITDLVTAVLLFGQVARRRSRAYLSLACGYLFSAAIVIPHALSFPGAFSETGLLGANDQTTAWLYVFWHAGFPLFALCYALFPEEGATDHVLRKHAAVAIMCATACVIGIVIGLTFLATVGRPLLPTIIQGGNYALLISTGTSPALLVLSVLVLLALWRRRKRTVLDVWLMVVMSIYMLDVLLSSVVTSARYDLGWYAGRTYLLVASCALLIVLLFEMNRLYARIAQAEGSYRGPLEAAPDAMVVVDEGQEIVLLNAQAEKRFGYSREQLVGQKVQTIIPEGFAERQIADRLRSTEVALAQEIDTGIELEGRRRDGSSFPIEIMLSPLQSDEGIMVTAAIRDISVRREAESQLRMSEERFRMLVGGVKDYAIFMLDPKGLVVSWNDGAERIKGYKSSEIVGRHFSYFYPPEQVAAGKPAAELLQAAADGQFEEEGWRLRKDGSRFWADVLITALHDEKGELRGFSKIIRDITARKTAEELLAEKMKELSRSNKDLEQFSYVASHDLQEPLRMVASYMQLLSRRYKGKLDADADDFIGFAVDGTTRMQALIRDLLAYSRVGTGGAKLASIASDKCLQQALVNLRGSIEASGALVTHDPLPVVMANEMLLAQLFQNLVGNAIKYQSPGTPKVHISAALNDEKQWIFSVQDNGIGIEPQNFERVFGMFQRLHKGGEFSGTGIGLAICKKIVEQHHGNISVESQPGKGSTFFFTLAQAPTSALQTA